MGNLYLCKLSQLNKAYNFILTYLVIVFYAGVTFIVGLFLFPLTKIYFLLAEAVLNFVALFTFVQISLIVWKSSACIPLCKSFFLLLSLRFIIYCKFQVIKLE